MSKMLKIGKKLCFPQVPSTWIPRTVEYILNRQDTFSPVPFLSHVTFPNCKIDNNTMSMSYDLTPDYCPPSVAPPKDAYLWSYDNISLVYRSILKKDPNAKRVSIEEGWEFDVISFLKTGNVSSSCTKSDDDDDDYLVRNNGEVVRVESLRGKNILVCCVLVPSFWLGDPTNSLRAVITYCEQQNNKLKADSDIGGGIKTEMVLVIQMRPNWENDEDAFNHFFSGFPSSWLAVPFSDSLRRDHICNSIGLVDHPMGLLVDSDQKVVFHRDGFGLNSFYIDFFCDPDNLELWWKKYNQLDLILGLDSEFVFSTNDYDSNKNISISELKQNVVGLYLCFDGSLIQTLDMICQECKARNHEFEVVLVHLPYKDEVNPPMFQEAISHVLRKLNISNWWVPPFDDFVSRRLWEAVEFSEEDELVIFDPHRSIADRFGKFVLQLFGVNSYPFTREFLVRRELEAIRAVTLESLLVYDDSSDHVLRIDDHNNVEEVPIAQLRGKNVILYVDNVQKPLPAYYKLFDWYNWIKTTRVANDFEVIFVSLTPFDNPNLLPMPMPMPWLVCPFNFQHTTYVSRKTLKSVYDGYLIAFGTDGHIIDLDAENLLNSRSFPSQDNLCEDVIRFLDVFYHINMTGVLPLPCLKRSA